METSPGIEDNLEKSVFGVFWKCRLTGFPHFKIFK
jgi:hypothetical protein